MLMQSVIGLINSFSNSLEKVTLLQMSSFVCLPVQYAHTSGLVLCSVDEVEYILAAQVTILMHVKISCPLKVT